MGNRRMSTGRFEALLDNLLTNEKLNGVNGSPFIIRNPNRIYLEEYFVKLPAINADIQNSAEGTNEIANPNFELLGTSATTGDVTFGAAAGTPGGIKIEHDGSNGDQVIILPHLDTTQSLWGVADQWGSENSVQWEAAITTGTAIDLQTIWAGLKKTNTQNAETDTDQAFFVYASTDDDWAGGELADNGLLHFVVSSGGTDYVSALPITVAASTNYRLGISIDSDRKVSCFVNGVQYNVTGTSDDISSGETGCGVSVTTGTGKSVALANDISLVPYVGIMGTGAAKHFFLHYEKISRILFE